MSFNAEPDLSLATDGMTAAEQQELLEVAEAQPDVARRDGITAIAAGVMVARAHIDYPQVRKDASGDYLIIQGALD